MHRSLFQEPIRSLGGEVLIKSNAKVVVSVEFFPMALDLLKLVISSNAPLSFESPKNLGLWGDQSLYFSWICEKGEFLLFALDLPPFGRICLELFLHQTRKSKVVRCVFFCAEKRCLLGKVHGKNPEYKRYIYIMYIYIYLLYAKIAYITWSKHYLRSLDNDFKSKWIIQVVVHIIEA